MYFAGLFAGPADNPAKYNLSYCSTPQRLYLMQFSLEDSFEEFVRTKHKFDKRYGESARLDPGTEAWTAENWGNFDVALIWDLSETETILLTHTENGTSAEFQDVSVCN